MTRTGPADVVMPACGLAAGGRPVPALPGSRGSARAWPVSREPAVARAVFPGAVPLKPASHRIAGRSRRRRPCPPAHLQGARSPHPPCPRRHVLAYPLYLHLLKWHAARYGSSFDPGRDML